MRFTYLSVLLLSLYVCFGAGDINVYLNGQVQRPFSDYSWVQTKNPSDDTVVYKNQPTYSFTPGYYSGVFFSCQKCINATNKDSIVIYANFGANIDTVLTVSVVKNTASGTVNYPPLSSAPLVSKYVSTSGLVKNAWNRIVIPWTAFGAVGTFDGIQLIGTANMMQNPVYIGSVVIGQYASAAGFLTINGGKSFALGVNLPTTPNNFGRDFGTNAWGYAGVNTANTFSNATAVFRNVNRNYGNAVRWNLFSDARAGIIFDEEGVPTALNPQVFADIDKAIVLARGFKVGICFSILDITFFQKTRTSDGVSLGGHADIISDSDKTAAFMKVVLIPIIQRYSSNNAIFAWEVMSNVEKILSDMPSGSPSPVSDFDLVTMAQYWSFHNTVAKQIKATTTVGQLVTVGSLSLKWINIYTPTYASQNGLPSLALDFYSVGYDNWMDAINYDNDTTFGTVKGSPFRQAVSDLTFIESKPIVVNTIQTTSTNFTNMYNALIRNGYAGVFENLPTINWNSFRAWGVANANNTLWPGVMNPVLPVFNTTRVTASPGSTLAPVPSAPAEIPTDITFVPTIIYQDSKVSAPWLDRSWAQLRTPSSTQFVQSGTTSYLFDPSSYDGLFFFCSGCINTATDYAFTFYVNGGTTSGQILNFAIVDDEGNKANGGGVPLAAVGVTIAANKWTKVVIPLYNYPSAIYSGIQIYGGLKDQQARVYIDQVVMLTYPPRSQTNNSTKTTGNNGDAIVSPATSVTFPASSFFTFAFIFVAVFVNFMV